MNQHTQKKKVSGLGIHSLFYYNRRIVLFTVTANNTATRIANEHNYFISFFSSR